MRFLLQRQEFGLPGATDDKNVTQKRGPQTKQKTKTNKTK
jgi:hypothetical protein